MTGRSAVLVTGAAGFVGRHAVAACARAGLRVTAVDLRPAWPGLAGAARWRRTDFRDQRLLAELASGQYTTVLHQAGISDTRVADSPALRDTNTDGALLLAEAARCGGANFVYASSHAVYGKIHQARPVAERMEDDRRRCSGPLNPYARSKLALDQAMRERFATDHGWVGLRYTNVFGGDEQDKGPMECILPQLVRQAASRGQVRVFADSLTAARDYIPVEIVADTLVLLVTQRIPAAVYNLGAGHVVSFADVLQWCAALRRQAGSGTLRVDLVPNPVADAYQYYTCADMSMLDAVLPARPPVTARAVRERAAELFAAFAAPVGVASVSTEIDPMEVPDTR